jgi:MFS family permease
MMLPIANVGVLALYLLFIWLGSAIISSYLSDRKGYGEKVGLACGLLLSALGVLIWLAVPAKQDSDWKVVGPMPWDREQLEKN